MLILTHIFFQRKEKTMKNKKLVFVLAATMLLAACGPKPATSESSGPEASANTSQATGDKSSAHKHSYGEWKETKPATCTEKGEKERTCECGEKQTQDIPMTDHKYGEWHETKAPTCSDDGEKERECSVCHTKETAPVVTDGHAWGDETTVAAPADGYVSYRTAKCSKDNNLKIALKGTDGTLAEGSKLKTDKAYPSAMKLGSNGQSISYKLQYNRNGTGKVYFYGAMDYFNASDDNGARGFYSGKNNNNESPNFELKVNDTVVDISDKKDLTYRDMFKKGESAEHAQYTNNELIEVGAIELKAGDNEIVFKRLESYNILIEDIVIVLDQYSDEVELEPQADTFYTFTADSHVLQWMASFSDANWVDLPETAQFNVTAPDGTKLEDKATASLVYAEGINMMVSAMIEEGYEIESIKVDGVAAQVDGGPGYGGIFVPITAGNHTVDIKTAKLPDPDTNLKFTADEGIDFVDLFIFNEENGNFYFDYDDVNYEAGWVFHTGDTLSIDNIYTNEGYEVDKVIFDGVELVAEETEFFGHVSKSWSADITAAGEHTLSVTSKKAVDTTYTFDIDEHVAMWMANIEDDNYVPVASAYHNMEGLSGMLEDVLTASFVYSEGLYLDLQMAIEDGYVIDSVKIDGVEATVEGEFGMYGVYTEVSANGAHSVVVTTKEAPKPNSSLVLDLDANVNEEDTYIWLDHFNFFASGEGYTAKWFYEEGETIYIDPVIASGYEIATITVDGVAATYDDDMSAYAAVLAEAGAHTVKITTKKSVDTTVTVTTDSHVAAYSGAVEGDSSFDFVAKNFVNPVTGENVELKDSAAVVFEEGMTLMISAMPEEGYEIATITVNGEEVEVEGDSEAAGAYIILEESGAYAINITTRKAKDTFVAVTSDDHVISWAAMVETDADADIACYNCVNPATGEDMPNKATASIVYADDITIMVTGGIEEGYVIDTITVNGEELAFMFEDGVFQVFVELIEKGSYTIDITTKKASPFIEGETGNGEVEDW